MKRLFIIFLFVLLLGATIGVWSYSYFESHEEAQGHVDESFVPTGHHELR